MVEWRLRLLENPQEMAFRDLLGQIQGRSLWQLLGGVRSCVPVEVSVGIQPTPQALLETMAGHVAAGYRRIRLKIKPGRDIFEIRAVRQAFPDLLLQVDANPADRSVLYSTPIAQSLCRLARV